MREPDGRLARMRGSRVTQAAPRPAAGKDQRELARRPV